MGCVFPVRRLRELLTMIRTCPKCRAFYADEALAFCLADGWPLLTVAPDSESWQEAVRAIEEKTQSLRKHQHKLRLRRLVLGGMTTLILAMVVSRSYVVETTPAVTIPPVRQSVAISRPPVAVTLTGEWPPEFLLAEESPSPSPTSDPSPTTGSSDPASDPPDSTTETSSPTSETTITDRPTDTSSRPPDSTDPTTDSSHSPTVVYSISGRVTVAGQPIAGVKIRIEGWKATSTTTDANGYYAFSNLRAGGSYTVIPPRDKTDLKPLNRSFDNLTQNGSADFNGTREREPDPSKPTEEEKEKEKEKCTRDDLDRDRKIIVEMYSARWRESVERERSKLIAENAREGLRAEATLIPQEPQVLFVKPCKFATVIYKYIWKIKVFDAATPVRDLNVPRQRIIGCGKMLGRWSCS